jgi:hypothetical protein
MLPDKLAEIHADLYTENEYGVTYQKPQHKLKQEQIDYLAKEHGVNPDLHDMCVNCQARQLIKYYNKPYKGLETNKFHVKCNGVQKNMEVSKQALHNLMGEKDMPKERALMYLKSTQDPVAWCNLMFSYDENNPKWRLRPHQKDIIRCTSLRIVERDGRRSGKTFSVCNKLIYLCFNKIYEKGTNMQGELMSSGPTIMIVTPYQSQLTIIFNELESLLKTNSDLANQVTTGTAGSLYVRSPHFKMEFQNGSRIEGFVSGVGNKADGSGGGTIRGFSADIIYLDEMDLIPEDILDKVVMPILLTRPETTLIGTSTPIGKRSKFYKFCKDDPTYKENHFPSTVLPQWEEQKREIEENNTKDAFTSEFMAEFLDGGHGVFKPVYVYTARQDYTYQEAELDAWWKHIAGVQYPEKMSKCIGIDWNKNAGSEFAVVAYDPSTHKWVTCETTNVAASEFSSISWKQEVIRLNYKWKPDYIYADEGYGHTIIEDLRLAALEVGMKKQKTQMDVQTMALTDRLKAFNFSGKVELRNPLDNKTFTKSGKDFLVENTIRILEDSRFWFSVDDQVLLKQLLNYIKLKTGASGKPIYGPEDPKLGDHRLDAIMLALGGLSLEFGIYSNAQLATSVPSHLDVNILDSTLPTAPTAIDILKAQARSPDKYGWREINAAQEQIWEEMAKAEMHKPKRNRKRTEPESRSPMEMLNHMQREFSGLEPRSRSQVVSSPSSAPRARRSELRRGR